MEGINKGGIAESKAIGLLYDTNKSEILAFINRINSKEGAKEPEDIVWEGMEALVNNIKAGKYQIQKDIPLKAYLKSILKNLWLKNLSSENARSARQEVYFEGNNTTEIDVSEIITEKETWDKYLAIFDKVGKNCKKILQMVFGLGYSIKDLAQKLIEEGLYDNEQVVRNAKSKCLKRVTEELTAN